MSEIPSDIVSSAAGTPFQAREVAKQREARRAAQSGAAERQVKSIDEADTVVDTDDADAQVFTDAEGGGSLGRDLSGETQEPLGDEQTGIVTDDDGQTHLDLRA